VWNAVRSYVYTLVGLAMPAPVVAKPTETISRDAFGQLLRRALNHLDEPRTLRDPEMASLVGTSSDDLDRAVINLISMGIKRLSTKDNTARHAEILDVTYVRPTVKQHAAAVELGLPYGTYRYQLRKAVALLEDELWYVRNVQPTGN
jgi:hypothetical protein